jgi:Tol biopolymer transport system component
VFRRSNPGNDLFFASQAGMPDSFSMVTAIAAINTADDETQCFLPLDRDELYFQSPRTGGGDVYMSKRNGTSFSAPILVAGIASGSDEGDPVVTPDGLTIYFRSDRPASIGGYNIYVATRTDVADAFGNVQLVPNVNTAADEGPSWISPDDCRLYVSSDVAGSNDIYVATRGVP